MKIAGRSPLSQKSWLLAWDKVHFEEEICFVYTDNDKPEMMMP